MTGLWIVFLILLGASLYLHVRIGQLERRVRELEGQNMLLALDQKDQWKTR